MKEILGILIAILTGGCASLVANTPSMEYCNKVTYTRFGNQISITADCQVPLGGSGGLPTIPLPKP